MHVFHYITTMYTTFWSPESTPHFCHSDVICSKTFQGYSYIHAHFVSCWDAGLWCAHECLFRMSWNMDITQLPAAQLLNMAGHDLTFKNFLLTLNFKLDEIGIL